MSVDQNSLIVYFDKINPNLGKLQSEVFELIRSRPGHTSKYYASILGKALNRISGRFTELYNLQLIKRGENKGDSCTWDVRIESDPLNKVRKTKIDKLKDFVNTGKVYYTSFEILEYIDSLK